MKLCCTSRHSTESLNADIDGEPLYRRENNATLQEGYTYLITGQITPQGDRFIIDFGLDNPNKDIALRIAARASTNTLGRNSRIKRKWGILESSAATPFTFARGWNFEIQVLFHANYILIGFDSMHIAEYAHRLPFTDINSLEIRGDIKDIAIEHKFTINYPIRRRSTKHISYLPARYAETADVRDLESKPAHRRLSEREFLPLPYYAIFSRGFFKQGYSVMVSGHVGASPHMIKVALQFSPNILPSPTIAVQVEFRFTRQSNAGTGETSEAVTYLNTYAEDEWIGEIKCPVPTGLRPQAPFNLLIVRSEYTYKIHLNNKHIYDYPHILNPDHVNTCLVEGNLKLIDVVIESD